MRIVLSIATGLILGYVLHGKKDQSIEAITSDVRDLAIKGWNVGRKRL